MFGAENWEFVASIAICGRSELVCLAFFFDSSSEVRRTCNSSQEITLSQVRIAEQKGSYSGGNPLRTTCSRSSSSTLTPTEPSLSPISLTSSR